MELRLQRVDRTPSFLWVVVWVMAVHVLVGLFVLWNPMALLSTPEPAYHRVVVKTVTLSPVHPVEVSAPVRQPAVERPKPKPIAKVEIPKPAPVIEKPQPVAKVEAPKPAKTKPKPAPEAKESKKVEKASEKAPLAAERVAAVEKARASLAQLREGSTSQINHSTVSLVVPTLSKPIAEAQPIVASPYDHELSSRLKTLLKLPEYGRVKVQLTLKRSGYVAKVEVLTSESEVNRRYVEKALPDLKFADFGNHFTGEETRSFTLVLSNDL